MAWSSSPVRAQVVELATTGDRTPPGYQYPADGLVEQAKKPIRRVVYPVYNGIVSRLLERKYGPLAGFPVDQWLWGQRGNDLERHRRRVNHVLPIAEREILIVGCGLGRDVVSWLPYHPASVTGVDYFDYSSGWNAFRRTAASRHPSVRLDFRQADLLDLGQFAPMSFDIVASDAVFEHVSDLPRALRELDRVLRPGGVVYATFGPLWYSWHGDHVSGYDGPASGYNHLLLPAEEYRRYIEQDTEHDGPFWLEHGLFSYLRPREYLESLANAGFAREFVLVVLSPDGAHALAADPELRRRATAVASELDLIASAMSVIYRKPAVSR